MTSRRSSSYRRVAVLMPAFDEPALRRTLDELRARACLGQLGFVRVFLVDDGGERPIEVVDLPPPNELFSIVLARHVANLGQGAALETARRLALQDGSFEAYVTMDSDGQHRVEDVIAMVDALDGADVALGDRFAGGSRVPRARAWVLHAARLFEAPVVGHTMRDAHNGLRAFRANVIERVSIRQNRMAHATELLRRVHAIPGLRVVEVPVTIQYTEASLAKGQRTTSGALAIAMDLFRRYLFGAPE